VCLPGEWVGCLDGVFERGIGNICTKAMSGIRILHLEDSPRDAALVQDLIEENGLTAEMVRASDRKQFEEALKRSGYDLILCDFNLPDFDGLSALKLARIQFPDTPVIIVSGAIDAGEAGECLKFGATDYLLKQRLDRLPSAIQRAIDEATTLKQRHAAEAQLRESEELFRSLTHVAPVGIFRTDAAGQFQFVNDRWCAMTGLSKEAALDQGWMQALHGEDHARVIADWNHSVQSNIPFRSEFRFQRPDGETVWVQSQAAQLKGANGELTGYVGAVFDLTAEKQAKAALEAERAQLAERIIERTRELTLANNELAQTSRMKDEFLANMSHELRTPLNAILGLIEALLEDVQGNLTPRQIKSLTTIASSGSHLLALINDILDLSKIEAGKLELYPEPVNIQEICQASLTFVRTAALKKEIEVLLEIDSGDQVVQADPKRLKQILVNLLSNAVKFTQERGRIGLRVKCGNEEPVMRFTVWDTGIGIAPEDQLKLFTPFTQIDTGLDRLHQGSGLGLALVARLTDLHGGSLVLESEPGQGSRFIVNLPHERPDPQNSVDEHGTLLDPGVSLSLKSGNRVLVVEDDLQVGSMLVSQLGRLDLTGTLISCGNEVMDAVIRDRPSLILMDIRMPNLDGWEVLKLLKKHPLTHDIPVIVVSGVDQPERSRQLGAVAHLSKPFRFEQLSDTIRRVFNPERRTIESETASGLRATGPLILLAEDNDANIQTIGGYLESKGYRLQYAHNGAVAVQFAREQHPDLILMDIQMPVMDGFTAIREIRSDSILREVPIVALTALAMRGDRERCLEAGATDYMSKPMRLKELLALVKKLLQDGAQAEHAKDPRTD
jgi:PAS domain S-box-containing protein